MSRGKFKTNSRIPALAFEVDVRTLAVSTFSITTTSKSIRQFTSLLTTTQAKGVGGDSWHSPFYLSAILPTVLSATTFTSLD